MNILTYSEWKTFGDNCLQRSGRVDENLFDICIDHFPFQLREIPKKTNSLYIALQEHYELKGVTRTDVECFQNKVALQHAARPHIEAIEREEDEIRQELLEEDARNRTFDQIALAGPQASDIFGDSYLEYLSGGKQR